jgi:uncharacterized damage-inducible protein DinB
MIMNTSIKLQQELTKVLSGEPWYGDCIYDIIEPVTFEMAYDKPPGAAHSIVEIVMHMVSWTEEVIDRMNGKPAGVPFSGDWPEPGSPEEQRWQNYVDDLKLVNVNLLEAIRKFPEEQWNEPIEDKRSDEPPTSYKELIYGFIQHQIYHAGQIAVLKRIVG